MTKKKTNSAGSPDNPVTVIRRRLGLKQSEFAEKLDYSDKYISMLETGERSISHKAATRILAIAPPGTRIEFLMGRDSFETERDLYEYECTQRKKETERLGIMEEELLKRIAAHAGFILERRKLSLQEFTNGESGYIFTDKNGKREELSWFGEYGVSELWLDFMDYAAFRLHRNIEKSKNRINFKIEYGGDKNG